jgi:hypothetical protein
MGLNPIFIKATTLLDAWFQAAWRRMIDSEKMR